MEERESISKHNKDEASSVSIKKRRLSNSSTSQSQLDALKTIFKHLGGTDWIRKDNWLLNDQSEEWQGITMKEGNVLILELSQNNLIGRLDDPVLVQAFTKLGPTLEQLWMSENVGLTGNLPSIFADESIFPNLSILDVGSNNLRGSLHPSFSAKRKTPFSWFDTSGNQLTSYFRYNNNDKHEINVDSVGPINTPLDNVHVATNLLTKSQCKNLVDLAVQYTEVNGWTTDRHKEYKTTDIDISICGSELLDLCNDHLKTTILPLMAHQFGFPISDLAIEDLFLAKYSATKGEQSMLPKHKDDSELSFVITLNEGFTGGGTRFIDGNVTVSPTKCGAGVFFCGNRLHSGVEVVEGERYILAGFVRVFPSTPETTAKLKNLLKQAEDH